jgi:hypothetical protein
MFMCVVNLKSVNKLDLTWKQSFLINKIFEVNQSKLKMMSQITIFIHGIGV